jgi:hypothetical protein
VAIFVGSRTGYRQTSTLCRLQAKAVVADHLWQPGYVSVYMRAIALEWDDRAFAEAEAFIAKRSLFRLRSVQGREWAEFEVVDSAGEAVLAGDLIADDAAAREELDELDEHLEGLFGTDAARHAVREHVREAAAIVGMQVFMSRYDDSVAAANAMIDYLEQRPGVLVQVDTVGWYAGPELILRESD